MKTIILCLLLASCGTKNSVQVSPVTGQINIVHSLDIQNALNQIQGMCTNEFPNDPAQVATCFQQGTASLLGILNTGTPKPTPTPSH